MIYFSGMGLIRKWLVRLARPLYRELYHKVLDEIEIEDDWVQRVAQTWGIPPAVVVLVIRQVVKTILEQLEQRLFGEVEQK